MTSNEWITEKKITDFLLNSTANFSLTEFLPSPPHFFGNTLKFQLMHSAAGLISSAVEGSVSYSHHVSLFLFPGWINCITNQNSKCCCQRGSSYSCGRVSSLSNISHVMLWPVYSSAIPCFEWPSVLVAEKSEYGFEQWIGTLLQIIWSHPKTMQVSGKGLMDFFWDWTRLSVTQAVMWN